MDNRRVKRAEPRRLPPLKIQNHLCENNLPNKGVEFLMHTRSLLSVWLCLLPVLFSSLTAELLRPFRTSYLFLGAWIVGGLSYLLFRLYCSVYEKAKGFRPLRYMIPIWFLLTLFFTVLIIENFGTRIVHSLMLHSDARFYNVTLILAAAILSAKGIKPLGRMAEIDQTSWKQGSISRG